MIPPSRLSSALHAVVLLLGVGGWALLGSGCSQPAQSTRLVNASGKTMSVRYVDRIEKHARTVAIAEGGAAELLPNRKIVDLDEIEFIDEHGHHIGFRDWKFERERKRSCEPRCEIVWYGNGRLVIKPRPG